MGDNHHNVALHHGHLGAAKYLPDEHVWEFSRKIDRRPYLVPFTYEDRLFSTYGKQRAVSTTATPAPLNRQSEDVLLKNCPQLAPGLQLYKKNDIPSRAVASVTEKWDSRSSSTLSLGNTFTAYSRRKAPPVAAFISSELPNSVQLVSSEYKPIEWHGEQIEVPVNGNREKALFVENRGRVYHIAFAETIDEKSMFMAVRYARSTTVFRPIRHKEAVAPNYSQGEGYVESDAEFTRLDTNPIIDIPVSYTGGCSHADVCFNPWYQQQFAIIDTQGNWSVWEVSQIHSRKNVWRANITHSGSIPLPEDKKTQHIPAHHDGWARIVWIADVHNVLVCDRKQLGIAHLGDTVDYQPVHLGFLRKSEWILDVVRSQANTSDFFVLTTFRIIWLTATPDDISASQAPEIPQARILLEWYHFRDSEDVGLRLSPLLVGTEFSLVLYSQLNSLAQVYRFAYSPLDSSFPVSVSDPSVFPLPCEDLSTQSGSQDSSQNIFTTILLQEVPRSTIDNPDDPATSLKLIKLIAQRADNSLVESLYVVNYDKDDDDQDYAFLTRDTRRELYPSSRFVDDDFVVEDWYEQAVPSSTHRRLKSWHERFKKEEVKFPLYIDLAWAHQWICHTTGLMGEGQNYRPSLEEWYQELGHKAGSFRETIESAPNACTLVELFDSAPRLEDLVSNVSSFESLMPQLEEASQPDGRGFSIKCQLLPDASHSDRTVKTSQSIDGKILHDMYDLLLRHSISPLPSGIPGSVRLAKEELIREILMELVLARVSLAKQRELKPAVEVKETEPQTSQNKSRLQSPLKAPVPQSQQSAPASSNVLSSQPSQTPTRAQQQDDSYSVLKLYTTVQGAEAPSKQARSILSHWSLEDDPAEYDWQAATRAAREEAQSHLETDQVRERRKKREKRKQKQKQDEDLASRRTTPAVPSVRPVVSASQPTQRSQRTQRTSMSRTPAPSASFTSHADSQLTDLPTYSFMSNSSQPQIMSQSERGVFGGREARRVKAPDRRKSRAAGF